MWKRVPEDLASLTGCAVLAYSRYGNGGSDVLEESRAVSYMHDEALEALPDVLAAFDVRDAVLVGQSDGASIALIYAGEIGARVRGVVCEAPHVFVEDVSVQSIARAKTAYESTELRRRLSRYHKDPDRTFYGWNDVWLHPQFRTWNIEDAVRKTRVPILAIQELTTNTAPSRNWMQSEPPRKNRASTFSTLRTAAMHRTATGPILRCRRSRRSSLLRAHR